MLQQFCSLSDNIFNLTMFDFASAGQTYNPYLENVTKKHSKQSSTAFKVYDIDGSAPNQPANQGPNRAAFPAASRRRETGHNDRFYDEQEYERRVRKRRARLLVATEEAFTHIKRLHDEQGKFSGCCTGYEHTIHNLSSSLPKVFAVPRGT